MRIEVSSKGLSESNKPMFVIEEVMMGIVCVIGFSNIRSVSLEEICLVLRTLRDLRG